MKCIICDCDAFTAATYVHATGKGLPAVACSRCGALAMTVSASTCTDERISIKDVIAMRRELGYRIDSDLPPTRR